MPALVALVAVLALVAAQRVRAAAREPAVEEATEEVAGAWIDPAHAETLALPDWADPRWIEHVREILAAEAPFALEPEADAEVLAALRAELAALSFVERVLRCDAARGEGLCVELALRKPVACISSRGEFALVDAGGVVLEGRWPLPPRIGRAFLPVIGPLGDPLFDRARDGDWLVEPEHTDAIDVALSLAENLSDEERAGLGRVVIDARAGRHASLDEPGVRLELAGARLALFGRAPSTDEPGELAAAEKWRSLARAVDLFERDPAAHDWDLVDLRWDRPEIALRDGRGALPVVAAASAEPRAPKGVRAQRARDDGRPHVR